jgi:Sap, sulfolipid-1-addressing protein
MNSNLTVVLSSAVVATFNPSLLAAVTVMLLLPQRKRLMLGYLLGAYTTSIIAGLVIVFALRRSGAVTTSKRTISPSEDIAIGGFALALAFVLITRGDARLRRWRERRKTASARHGSPEPWQERILGRGSVWLAFLVGALVSFPGVSYLNALDHIVRLNPPTAIIVALVLYFCLMQQILLELPLVASVFASDQTQQVVVQAKAWLGRHGRPIAQTALAGIGILLVVRGLVAIH